MGGNNALWLKKVINANSDPYRALARFSTVAGRGTPYGIRHMHGNSSHTFPMINKDNVRTWVKYHFLTQ